MSFKDIFKKSFLEGYAGTEITTTVVVVGLAVACVLALYIFMVYRVLTRKTFYSKNFNISLVGITIITTALILTMQSSVVLSLGMVGALSIVRFRTAIKDPMDLMFLFWSISVGIICGAGLAQVAVVLSIVVTLLVLVLDQFPVAKAPMILVLNASNVDLEKDILRIVGENASFWKVKTQSMTAQSMDMVIEVRTAQAGELVRKVMDIQGVTSASVLSHDGEVTF